MYDLISRQSIAPRLCLCLRIDLPYWPHSATRLPILAPLQKRVTLKYLIHLYQIVEKDPKLMRSDRGGVLPVRTTPTADVYKIKLQDPSHINALFRMEDRAPPRGLRATQLVFRKAMGATAKMASMAAAPFLLKARIPRGKARFTTLPMLSFRTNVVTMDENANVTFGVQEYPPWVSLLPPMGSYII